MSEKTKEVAVAKPPSEIGVAKGGIQLRSVEDLLRMARFVVEAGMAPKGMEHPATCLIAIQTGLEAGLTPMAALRALAVINNRPSWTGKAALALVRQSGWLKASPIVTYRGTVREDKTGLDRYGNDYACVVSLWRVGDPEPHTYTFSVADAKEARLWNKQGARGPTPWVTFPKRMLYWRALGLGLDELFGDVLLNLRIAEVERDIEGDEQGPRDVFVESRPVEPPPADLEDPLYTAFRGEEEPPGSAEPIEDDRDDSYGPEEPGCEHEWILEGDPLQEEEPVEVCALCGAHRQDVAVQPAML